jgi:hypothetical protein
MSLEEFIAHLNAQTFWKEFTFAQNKFTPQPGKELELADNLVWLGDYAFVLQLKQREDETENPDAERTWFRKRILDKATRQIRDTLRFLDEHEQIRITNERGHVFDIRRKELTKITKIVVYLGGRALPKDCSQTRYHLSRTAGFIHFLAAHDYLGIIEKLGVPEDIRRYFEYRETVAPRLRDAGVVVDESDIMGAFLDEEDLPSPHSREILRSFVQDNFDLSWLIGNLHDHIKRSEQPYDYYRIMLEFARVPRAVWREVKVRFMKSLEAVRENKFTQPFRLTFPATDCTFMLAPLNPQIPTTGPEGEKTRVTGLQNLTHAAMYDAKTSKGVGILISRDGEYIQLDWSLLNAPWKPDPLMDTMLAKSNPFREVSEKMIDSFLFETATETRKA